MGDDATLVFVTGRNRWTVEFDQFVVYLITLETVRKHMQRLYSKTNKMHRCTNFILFWNDTLHVSDGLSVHHQEFLQFHLVPDSEMTAVSVWQMLVAVCAVLNSWRWTERPSETCRGSFQNKINLIHWCILLVLLYKWCYDERPYERQTRNT